MNLKKILIILLALIMTMSIVFTGCSNNNNENNTNNNQANNNSDTNTNDNSNNNTNNNDNNENDNNDMEQSNFNETGFPIVDEKISVRTAIIADPRLKSNDEKWFFQHMEELTNISFEFEEIQAESLIEKRNLLLASGDYPDLFMKCNITKEDELRYGPEGVFVQLEDMISEYAPNITNALEDRPAARKVITTPDGHIYTLPAIDPKPLAWVFPFVNDVWLEELDMEKPTNLDEFYDMLVAFKTQDPNGNGEADEIPFSMQENPENLFVKCFGNNWGLLFGLNDTFVDDDVVLHAPTQPQFKDMMLYLRRLYEEELLDNELFTHTVEQFNAKGQGEDQLYGSWNHLAPFLVVGAQNEYDFNPIDPFPYEGEQMINTNMAIAGGTFVITNKAENPEALIRWADYLYTEEGGRKAWMGVEGEHYEMNDDGTWEYILEEGESQNDVRKDFFQGHANHPNKTPDLWSKINDPLERRVIENRASQAEFTRDSYPDVYFTTDQQDRLSVLSSDINEYVNQTIVQMITGDIDIEASWDDYISTIEKMGLEEMLEIHQTAYDAYNQ